MEKIKLWKKKYSRKKLLSTCGRMGLALSLGISGGTHECVWRGAFLLQFNSNKFMLLSTDKHEAINLYHQKFIHSFPTHRAKKWPLTILLSWHCHRFYHVPGHPATDYTEEAHLNPDHPYFCPTCSTAGSLSTGYARVAMTDQTFAGLPSRGTRMRAH